MDVAAIIVPLNLKPVVTTSMVNKENRSVGESVSPPAKRRRFGEEVNRVAEILLVLSALGRMRGGETPTESELKLMVEARSKLAGVCQELTPKDIIGRDGVRGVIEDLGLNFKLKDQRLGSRATKLTISEKVSLGKGKMEEAEKYSKPKVSIGYASNLSQPSGSVVSPGLAKNVSVTHQWPRSEVVSVNTKGSHYIMESASQGTGVSSANYYATSSSTQPQTTISFSTAADKKVPVQSSARGTDLSFRPFTSQTPRGPFSVTNQSLQGMHHAQTFSFENNHVEIAKIIHKFLQPQVKQYPLWNQPSRDYMSRAMTCQMCEVTVNEVETLLICDACEKAYHLKCLQGNSMQGAPKSEWHCSRCVQLFNGKPFPPIYGRTITTSTAKVHSTTAGVQSSIAKKVGSIDIMGNQQKPIVTTSPAVQNSPARVSLIENPNLTAIASTSSTINNGLVSKLLTLVGTMSSTSSLAVGNQVPANTTSYATPSTPITASLVAQAPPVTENGDSSSAGSGTADHTILNTDFTTEVHPLTVTLSSNSKPAVSHSETTKAPEDAGIGQALNAHVGPGAPTENIARCENPWEITSQPGFRNDLTSENGQESSKDATEICF